MRTALYLTFVTTLLASQAAFCQSDAAAEIAALKSEIGGLLARLERLEQAQSMPQTAVGAAPPAAAAPAETIPAAERTLRFAGDLRYRHESINEDGEAERHRHRIRGRFGVTADVNEDLRVGLVLATGDDDPVSANQTLDGGFNRKSFGVDRAFFTWQATDALGITGGKMANPFYRPGGHHLIYDADLNPEGLALRYSFGDWFVNYAGLMVEERGAADDSILLGGQVGFRRALGNGMRLTTGVSYYDYLQTQGQIPFYDGTGNGNRVDSAGRYVSDFNEAELFAELELEIANRPLTLFADYVRNGEAVGPDTGFALGAQYGEVTRPRTWSLGYAYQDLEADAVIATFTDSDFGGSGTDSKGHVFEVAYGLRERWTLGFRYFLNRRGADAGNEHDYNRLMADVSFAY